MPTAIVMVNVDIGKENEVAEKLLEIPLVRDVYVVYGIHDIVAIVESSSMDELRSTITDKIRKLDGVKSTMTSIVVMHKRRE